MPGQFRNEASARMLINRLKCDEKDIDTKIQKIKQDLYPEPVVNVVNQIIDYPLP